MEPWQEILKDSITNIDGLRKHLDCDNNALHDVIANFPMRINRYFSQLIKFPKDPLWLQSVPDMKEINDEVCFHDSLGEENLGPVPNLVHKYPFQSPFLSHHST